MTRTFRSNISQWSHSKVAIESKLQRRAVHEREYALSRLLFESKVSKEIKRRKIENMAIYAAKDAAMASKVACHAVEHTFNIMKRMKKRVSKAKRRAKQLQKERMKIIHSKLSETSVVVGDLNIVESTMDTSSFGSIIMPEKSIGLFDGKMKQATSVKKNPNEAQQKTNENDFVAEIVTENINASNDTENDTEKATNQNVFVAEIVSENIQPENKDKIVEIISESLHYDEISEKIPEKIETPVIIRKQNKQNTLESKLAHRDKMWEEAATRSKRRINLLQHLENSWLETVEEAEADFLPPPLPPKLLDVCSIVNAQQKERISNRLRSAWNNAKQNAELTGNPIPPIPHQLVTINESKQQFNKKNALSNPKRVKMKKAVGLKVVNTSRKKKVIPVNKRQKNRRKRRKKRISRNVPPKLPMKQVLSRIKAVQKLLVCRIGGCDNEPQYIKSKNLWSEYCEQHMCLITGCANRSSSWSGMCATHDAISVSFVIDEALVQEKSMAEKREIFRLKRETRKRLEKRKRILDKKLIKFRENRLRKFGYTEEYIQTLNQNFENMLIALKAEEAKRKKKRKVKSKLRRTKSIKRKLKRQSKKIFHKRAPKQKSLSKNTLEKDVKLPPILEKAKCARRIQSLRRGFTSRRSLAASRAAAVSQRASIDARMKAASALPAWSKIDAEMHQRVLSRAGTSRMQKALSEAFKVESSSGDDSDDSESDSEISANDVEEVLDENGEVVKIQMPKMTQRDAETDAEYLERMTREYALAKAATMRKRLEAKQFKPAQKCQRMVRGWMAREKYKILLKEVKAARQIQRIWRGLKGRRIWEMLCSPVWIDILTPEGLIDKTCSRVRCTVISIYHIAGKKYASVEVMKTTKGKECGLIGVKDDVLVENLWGNEVRNKPVPWAKIVDKLRPSSVVNNTTKKRYKAIKILRKSLAQVHSCLDSIRDDLRKSFDVEDVQESTAITNSALVRLEEAVNIIVPPLPHGTKPNESNQELFQTRGHFKTAKEKLMRSLQRVVVVEESLLKVGHFGTIQMGPRRQSSAAQLEVIETEIVEAVAEIEQLGNWVLDYDTYGQSYYVNTKTGATEWQKPRLTNMKNLAKIGFFSNW